MTTQSTVAIYDTLRAAFLASAAVTAKLGAGDAARLYMVSPPQRAPDAGPFPFVVLRVLSHVLDGPFDRSQFAVELMLFYRPRSNAAAEKILLDLGDALDQAMIEFVHLSDGVFWIESMQRDPIPAGGDEIDRELVQHRHLYSLSGYLAVHTSQLT